MRKLALGLSLVLLASLATLPSVATGKSRRAKVVKCKGKRATKVGNKKSNVIVGTKGKDVIVAKGGSDNVFGRGGKDRICGGKGADLLDALKGKRERIYGGKGKDACFGPRKEHR